MPKIIVEGTDCSGKDSLIKELKRITGYPVIRGSSFELSVGGSESMRDVMLDNLKEENVIFNRSYISNIVYAPLFNYPMISKKHIDDVISRISDTGMETVLVYLHTDVNTLKNRMKNRGDDDVSPNDLKNILNRYTDVIIGDLVPNNILSYDTSVYSSEQIANDVITYFNEKPSY